jgi:hypothetical protein
MLIGASVALALEISGIFTRFSAELLKGHFTRVPFKIKGDFLRRNL